MFIEANRIGPEWIADYGNGHLEVRNPANGELLGSVPLARAADVERCIAVAARAGERWRATPARARARALRRWHDLIAARKEDLATILTLEQGKPLSEARAEIDYAASFVQWYAEEAERIYGRIAPSIDGTSVFTVEKVPVGVVAAITPWNAPCSMVTRKVAPAIAAGCSVVLKPAEATPFSALALAELAAQAGIADGVLNVITGMPAEIGAVFTQSRAVRKISFTGSTPVARRLFAHAADSMKRLSLEAGGNAPFIVLQDADLDVAIDAAMIAKFRSGGQSCVAANRFFIHASVYEPFKTAFTRRVASLTCGAGMDHADVGPVIDANAARRIASLIDDATAQGATVLCGGYRAGTAFVNPAIVCDISPKMKIYRDEIFGPVAGLCAFEDVDALVSSLNAEDVGLIAYIISQDSIAARNIANRLDVGMVGINTGLASDASMPFGGVKGSGIGREGSIEGIEAYLETKYIKATP
nr:NAD-dependent succinate-semialdehyde dehydrogenase [Cupriavidus plantarum]